MKRFGEKLKILRTQHQLTTRQLSDQLGITNSYISQFEVGRKTPSLKLAIQIADYFGVDVNQLVRDELELEG